MKSENVFLLVFLGIAECTSDLNNNFGLFTRLNEFSGKHNKLIRPNIRRVRSNPKEKVMYQYPVYKTNNEPVKKKVEFVPGIGEVVLQDRFEPRPLFAYKKQQQQQQQQSQGGVASATIDAPTMTKNLYQSPYSSYNPPDFVPDENPKYFYPPNGAPSTDDKVRSESSNNASAATFGPPLAPPITDDDESSEVTDPMVSHKYQEGPPDYPPKTENDIYYPPDSAPNYQDTLDLAAPPNDHNNHFPQYLYDQHHYDHHVYEEIPHSTMAPVKEDKRVSGTHYSYYYLGRKLWYVPLYFSIYFIIYVTVLIVKSIARHKVNLKYKWIEHESRQMRSSNINTEEHDRVDQNILFAIQNATEKYSNVLQM